MIFSHVSLESKVFKSLNFLNVDNQVSRLKCNRYIFLKFLSRICEIKKIDKKWKLNSFNTERLI